MKKALKTVFAAVLTGAMAMSAFAVNASAGWYVNNDGSKVWYNDGYYDGYYYGSYATVTANQYQNGTITVSVPSGATGISYS